MHNKKEINKRFPEQIPANIYYNGQVAGLICFQLYYNLCLDLLTGIQSVRPQNSLRSRGLAGDMNLAAFPDPIRLFNIKIIPINKMAAFNLLEGSVHNTLATQKYLNTDYMISQHSQSHNSNYSSISFKSVIIFMSCVKCYNPSLQGEIIEDSFLVEDLLKRQGICKKKNYGTSLNDNKNVNLLNIPSPADHPVSWVCFFIERDLGKE